MHVRACMRACVHLCVCVCVCVCVCARARASLTQGPIYLVAALCEGEEANQGILVWAGYVRDVFCISMVMVGLQVCNNVHSLLDTWCVPFNEYNCPQLKQCARALLNTCSA